MARRDNVCSYLDIALQHISDKVLTNMRRHITRQETLDLIARLRQEVPGIHIRTTLMVGFPGEGEEEFDEFTTILTMVIDDFYQNEYSLTAFAYNAKESLSLSEEVINSVIDDLTKQAE